MPDKEGTLQPTATEKRDVKNHGSTGRVVWEQTTMRQGPDILAAI